MLKDKVALITGGSSGIGQAAARRLASGGARVVLVGQDRARLEAVVADLGPERASCILADVSSAEATAGYVDETLARHGRIDILFANAGIEGAVAPITDYPVEEFDRVLAVNVRGVWLGLKYVMAAMARDGGGSIIISSSITGFKGVAMMSGYVASKHAVLGLMRVAALEGAPLGIRVNTIHPAPIDTPMMQGIERKYMPNDPTGARTFIEGTVPLRRYGTPDEVATLVAFLASDASRFCTGGAYPVDGGVLAG